MCWWSIEKYQIDKFAIAGGVASNGTLRGAMEEECRKRNVAFYHPSPILCTDNAAMIAITGYYKYLDKDFCTIDKPAYSRVTI